MRAYFFGEEASTASTSRRLAAELDGFTRRGDRHPRPRRDRGAVRRARVEDRAGRAHRRAAVARLGGARAAHRLRGQRDRHAEPAAGRARQLPGRDVRLHLDEQGLRRPPELPAAAGARDALGAARRPRVVRRHPDRHVDRPLHALAVRRLEGRGRHHGAGVRALLRHADRLLPRRLPDRPAARRRPAARLPRLPHEVHRHRASRTRSSATRASRSATTSTRTTSSAPSTRSTRRRRPRRSTTSAAAASPTSRCSRRSPSARRSPAASSTTRSPTRPASATTSGTCRTSRDFERDYPEWQLTYGIDDVLRRHLRAQRRAPGPPAHDEALVVIPAHNEEGSIADTVTSLTTRPRTGRRSTTRSSSSTTRRPTARPRSIRRLADARPARPLRAQPVPQRLRLRGARRPRGVHRRRGRDRDGRPLRRSRRPRRLLPAARSGLRLRVRLALHAGRQDDRLPARQAGRQPARQLRHPPAVRPRLQRHDQRVQGLPARGHRDRPAAAQPSLQPDRRAAAEGDRARPLLRDRSRSAGATAGPASPSCGCRRWAVATCSSCCYVFLEHHLSRGDYRRPDAVSDRPGRWRAGSPGARPNPKDPIN